MDIYTNPLSDTYQLHTIFSLPHQDGSSQKAIAFTQNQGTYLVVVYSVLMTFIFSAAWTVITFAVLAFKGRPDSRIDNNGPLDVNRCVGLVGFFNAREPFTAMLFQLQFVYSCMCRKEHRIWACSLLIVSFLMYYGGLAAGIVVPNQLLVGSLAPANPLSIFFPKPPASFTPAEYEAIQAVKAPAAMRSVGSVEAAKVTLRQRVSVGAGPTEAYYQGDSKKPIFTTTYSYNVSGWDFGLQHATGLQQQVQGACTTDYSWLVNISSTQDTYKPWGMSNETLVVYRKGQEAQDPPYAVVVVHPAAEYTTALNGNYSFGFIPNTAGRTSFSTSTDPWYLTTSSGTPTSAPNQGPNQVAPGRPALSCWQANTWSFGHQTVDSVFKLGNLSGFALTPEWRDYFRIQLSAPKVVDLGISLGRSMLVSATTSLNGNFDASSASIHTDLERLILAGFVSSRNIFIDSTMTGQDPTDTGKNAALNPQGKPAAGVADFVLSSGDVSTVNLATLVTVPVILGLLWLIKGVLMLVLLANKNRKALEKGLEATQLYRNLHHYSEKVEEFRREDRTLSNSSHFSKWKKPTKLAPYVESSNHHIHASKEKAATGILWETGEDKKRRKDEERNSPITQKVDV